MPFVQIKGVAGYLTPERKKDLIERVTDAVVAVEGEHLRAVTWVLVEDVPTGAWGVAGQPVTADDLRRMAASAG